MQLLSRNWTQSSPVSLPCLCLSMTPKRLSNLRFQSAPSCGFIPTLRSPSHASHLGARMHPNDPMHLMMSWPLSVPCEILPSNYWLAPVPLLMHFTPKWNPQHNFLRKFVSGNSTDGRNKVGVLLISASIKKIRHMDSLHTVCVFKDSCVYIR